MGIQLFEAWVSQRLTQTLPLTSLNGSLIGVDALYFLDTLLKAHREPLLSALGGFPLALESMVKKELDDLRSGGLQLHFVFNGLDFGIKEDPFGSAIKGAQTIAHAFEVYESDRAQQAIDIFRASGVPSATQLVPFLKKVLHEHDVPFTVAPFSALPQLVYYEQHPSQFIDAVYGPSETFLFGIDKLITKIELTYETRDESQNGYPVKRTEFHFEKSVFRYVNRKTCLEELSQLPIELFQQACLISGSSFLTPFPPLHNPTIFPKGVLFRDAVNMIMSNHRSVIRLCATHSGDPLLQNMDYPDRYKRVMACIRHHPIITKDGDVEVLNKEQAPTDVQECVGYRLPEELNMYLSRGMLRPNVLEALSSGTILITAPLDGGESAAYQNLVKVQLRPLREETLVLLAESLNKYYSRAREVTTRLWFEPDSESKIAIKTLIPSRQDEISAWNVKSNMLIEQRRKLEVIFPYPLKGFGSDIVVMEAASESILPGSLAFAIRSLTDASFAASTITPKPTDEDRLLKTRHEVISNAVWRFLQLRNYVDKKHQLTHWGKVLEASLAIAGSNKDQEEAVLIAVELLRLKLLNADTMFQDFSGAPVHGSTVDKRNCMLVSRVASLGKLHHQARGYRGPLSRHMLAYHSIVQTLHSSLRDSLEISLATMFLKGRVDRDRDDWMDLALSLPLYEEHSCALGVVTMNYFDELNCRGNPTSDLSRDQQKHLAQGWVANGDFLSSFRDALQLWDAVYAGVKAAGAEVADRSIWDATNEWLSQRR